MDNWLETHVANSQELSAQLNDLPDAPILIVDEDNNDKKYILTDVRFDGTSIVCAIAHLSEKP